MPNPKQPLLCRRRQRIHSVSRFLMFLSLVAMAYQLAWAVAAYFLPVVSKGPRYDYWNVAAESATAVVPRQFSSPRIFLELSGPGPEYRNFAWDVSQGGSGIVEGREWLARVSASLPVAYAAWGAWLFFRLFGTYLGGDVFQLESVRRLRGIGVWMMGNWAVALAFNLSKTWWQVSPSFTLVWGTGNGLFAGLFICLVAWIMEEAQLLAEEQSLTV